MQFFVGTEISPSLPAALASGNNENLLAPPRTLNPQQDHKLMFGLLFSIKSLTARMDPTALEKGNLVVPHLTGQGCSFHSFRTNTYKLSFMEIGESFWYQGVICSMKLFKICKELSVNLKVTYAEHMLYYFSPNLTSLGSTAAFIFISMEST